MTHNRRSVLRAMGALGAVALYPVGSVGATCEETVDEMTITDGPVLPLFPEASDEFSTDSFADSDLPDAKMNFVMEWNEEDGPTTAEFKLQHHRDGEWVTIAVEESSTGFVDRNQLTMQVVDGMFYLNAEAEAVVGDDERYRFEVSVPTEDTVIFEYEIDAHFRAFDDDC